MVSTRKAELLNDKPEGDDGDAGSHPGEKRPFIGRVITVAPKIMACLICNEKIAGSREP